MIVQVQLKDAKHQVQEDLGSKNRNLYTTILQTQTLEILLITPPPVMSLAANYSQYQIPDKILVSNFMNVRPRSLMSESL